MSRIRRVSVDLIKVSVTAVIMKVVYFVSVSIFSLTVLNQIVRRRRGERIVTREGVIL